MPHSDPRLTSALLRKFAAVLSLDAAERTALLELEANPRRVPARTLLIEEGRPAEAVFVLRQGWAIRHKDLADGRRQVADFLLPGDLAALDATTYDTADFSVSTLTESEISAIPPTRIVGLFAEHPRLGAAIAAVMARDRAILTEHLVSLGRRSAQGRLAHILVELWRRLRQRGLVADGLYRMPASQTLLADTLGLSTVHVNRVLKRLERDGLVRVHRQFVEIRDIGALVAIAGFDSSYLHEGPIPAEVESAVARMRDSGSRHD